MWAQEAIPNEWKIGIIVPVYKKGDKAKCCNYRGISLLNIAFKVLEAILKKRIEPAYTPHARKNKAGFKRGVGCRDQIFSLPQLLEQRYQFQRPTTVAFIDFKAAFDSASRQSIWNILESLGLSPKLVTTLKAMYNDSSSAVRVYDSISRAFVINSGVRQGSILAPFLFRLLIDHIMLTALSSGNYGLALDDMTIPDLDFADDIALLDDNIQDMQGLLDAVMLVSQHCGLLINTSKTEYMTSVANLVLQCNGEILNQTDKFTYLGSSIQLDGNIEHEIRLRIGRANKGFHMLNPVWRTKSLPRKIKLKVYQACVLSILLYSCETWPLKKSDLSSLTSFDLRCRKRIQGPAAPSSDIPNIIRKRRLKWLGHVLRMEESDIPNAALEFTKGDAWKRPPGGMRMTWRKLAQDDLKPYLKPPNMSQSNWNADWFDIAKETAANRSRWRGLVRDIVAGNDQRWSKKPWWMDGRFAELYRFIDLNRFIYRLPYEKLKYMTLWNLTLKPLGRK